MPRLALALPFALLAAPAGAQTGAQASDFTSGEGTSYVLTLSTDGAVLTSLTPVLRVGERGASLDGTDTLYLGRSCDALAPGEGTGTWGQANGGFLVTLPSRSVGFPRQELPLGGAACPL